VATLGQDFSEHLRPEQRPAAARGPVNLLPGPVSIRPEVQEAFARPPVSHRAPGFVADIQRVRRRLSMLVGSERVQILLGSGTMANDAIAAQLSLLPGKGLVATSGEFGERLVDHARRMRLDFEPLRTEWGRPIERDDIEGALDRTAGLDWLWTVHCETSTGVLNDLELLKDICARRDIRLIVDCISSIGTVPVDLGGVYLASCVSGKGLGAFPGLSMVFHDHEVLTAPDKLPRYLDLGLYAAADGVPFTMSSNLVYALEAALDRFDSDDAFDEIAEVSTWLRRGLRDLGYRIVAGDGHSSPAVITVELPEEARSVVVGRRLENAGYFLSYNSAYLIERNWIQVCLMGEVSKTAVAPLLDAMSALTPAPTGRGR
jgi:aspartate aminotransferase-like enzyme